MQFKKEQSTFRHALSIPFIWSVLIPLVFLDMMIELYHRVCFPLYGLKLVDRSAFICVDRQKLSYLTWYEKINCAYCGYANGLLRYGVEIGARTEAYWCGIRHQDKPGFNQPSHHKKFLAYGDEEAYKKF